MPGDYKPTISGRCKLCGAESTYSSTLDIDQSGMHPLHLRGSTHKKKLRKEENNPA